MNVIFGKENFQNEIIWKRTSAHNDAKKWGPVHDTILYYVKSKNFTWNQQYTKYDQKYIDQNYRYKDNEGRLFRMGDLTASGLSGGGYEYDWKGHTKIWRYPLDGMRELENEGRLVYSSTGLANYKRYLDEMSGVPISDVITDISPIGSQAAERLGYPTQKPIALLERIISASSQPGDLILDPFCGCGTAIQAAEKLERQWIGIDVTRLAISLIERRLAEGFRHVDLKWEVIGVPKDINAARDLALRDKCQFQFWACSLVQAWPYDRKIKKGADKGIDGVKFFYDDNAKPKKIIISVKGGDNVNPGMVRDLHGVIEREKAALGLFITLAKPTRPMKEAAMSAGFYEISTNNSYRDTPIPRIQLVRVEDLLRGRGPKLPPDYASGRGTFRHNRAVGEATEKNPIF
jgi:site-specific DNA-methyltransferase (adenine-specific)